jgi:hypothetical protein
VIQCKLCLLYGIPRDLVKILSSRGKEAETRFTNRGTKVRHEQETLETTRLCELDTCHGICRRMQAVCAVKLMGSGSRYKGQAEVRGHCPCRVSSTVCGSRTVEKE